MTRQLKAEIESYLVEHGQGSAYDIAKGLRARAIDVLAIVRADGLFDGPFRDPNAPSDQKLYYRLSIQVDGLAGAARERRPGRPRKGRSRSQCDRILDQLADGAWQTTWELSRASGSLAVHSRVTELRERGHVILMERRDGHYCYRLVSGPLSEPDPETSPRGNRVDGVSAAAPPRRSGSGSLSGQAQLELETVASC